MCGIMVDIKSPTDENRRGKNKKKKKERKKKIEITAAKYNGLSITVGGHKKKNTDWRHQKHNLPWFTACGNENKRKVPKWNFKMS